MIRTAKILSGWPADVPALKDRTFEFGKGLTVIFGRNGSGKSTLLRSAGAYAGCHDHGGWSSFVDPLKSKDPAGEPKTPYPAQFQSLAPGGAKAEIDWDGAPAFLHIADESDAKVVHFDLPHDIFGDGIGAFQDERVRSSAGQKRLRRLEQLRAALAKPPDLTKVRQKGVNDTWLGMEQGFVDYVKSLRGRRKPGKVTVLLDEPDRSMDLGVQAKFWGEGIPRLLADGLQVIASTHSPYALFIGSRVPDATVIDLEPGYAQGCADDLREFVLGAQ